MTSPHKGTPTPAPYDREVARILGELAGAASLCWNPRPTGEFDSGAATKFVDQALRSLAATNPVEGRCRRHGGDDMPSTCPDCRREAQESPAGSALRELDDAIKSYTEYPNYGRRDQRSSEWIAALLQRARDRIVEQETLINDQRTTADTNYRTMVDAGKRIAELERELAEARAAHNELLYAVARKFPNETRHQTALRYIRQAEMLAGAESGAAIAAERKETK